MKPKNSNQSAPVLSDAYQNLLVQNQRNQSKQNYINAIANYWRAYYQLRASTMYDIEKQVSLYKTEK